MLNLFFTLQISLRYLFIAICSESDHPRAITLRNEPLATPLRLNKTIALPITPDPIISLLAGPPRYSTSVKRRCQFARSSVSAFEQLGEQIESCVSCLALLGSNGTAGCSAAGAQSIDLPAQPISKEISMYRSKS